MLVTNGGGAQSRINGNIIIPNSCGNIYVDNIVVVVVIVIRVILKCPISLSGRQ